MLARIPWFPASRRFDISQNKFLRTAETTAWTINSAGDAASGFLKTVFITIPPSLLDVVITYRDRDVGLGVWGIGRPTSVVNCSASATHHSGQFKVFEEMYEARMFQLVLRADVSGWAVEHSMGVLERAVEGEDAKGGLDYLECEQLIISEVRTPHSLPRDCSTQGSLYLIVGVQVNEEMQGRGEENGKSRPNCIPHHFAVVDSLPAIGLARLKL